METWKSFLKADPIPWLLEKDNPSVRRLTLTEILDHPWSDPEVEEAGRDVMSSGLVPRILAKQTAGGHWEPASRFYTAKYKGTAWQLIILAELGADGGYPKIRKACEFILERSQDSDGGAFAQHTSARQGGGLHGEVIPCLTGNMVWSLIRLGLLDDPRVKKGIDWIVRYQRFDDGSARAPKGWPYDRYEMCWGKHVCHMGVVKSLKALAAIPEAKRTAAVKDSIAQAAEYLLAHHIHKKSHDLGAVSKPGWRRFAFPWMYQTDIVEVLGLLTSLGYRDPRMREAVDVVISKQTDAGAWNLDNTFNGRFQYNIERKGWPSKWVTAHAVAALKRWAGRS